VITSGDNSHGIILGDGLGIRRMDEHFYSSLDIGDGLAATTSGASSHALVISENTALTMDTDLVIFEPDPDPDDKVDEPSVGPIASNGLMVIGAIDSFDTFVATGANSRAEMNYGIIYGTFTVGNEVVGNLGNNRLIESADGPGGVAVQFTGTTNDIFELQTQGVVGNAARLDWSAAGLAGGYKTVIKTGTGSAFGGVAFGYSPTSFEVRGPNAGRDRLRLGLSVAFEATDDITIRASYEGVFSSGQVAHAVRLGLNVKF
jgi:hypothetical protein